MLQAVVSGFLVGCLQATEANPSPPKAKPEPPVINLLPSDVDYGQSIALGDANLLTKFPTPKGLRRLELEPNSFANWLRFIPVNDTRVVLAYNGNPIPGAPAAAVIPLDVGRGDVQQCADTILRLFAEYLWVVDRADDLSYHFTSGDVSSWSAWRAGERFVIKGAKVSRIQRAQRDASYSNFKSWLRHTFLYAGTRSMSSDALQVPLSDAILPGDFFVTPGSPGHAVIVLDVATGEQGSFALLGQGFMPAQQLHVLRNQRGVSWFKIPEEGEYLSNPSWSAMPRSAAYRFQ